MSKDKQPASDPAAAAELEALRERIAQLEARTPPPVSPDILERERLDAIAKATAERYGEPKEVNPYGAAGANSMNQAPEIIRDTGRVEVHETSAFYREYGDTEAFAMRDCRPGRRAKDMPTRPTLGDKLRAFFA